MLGIKEGGVECIAQTVANRILMTLGFAPIAANALAEIPQTPTVAPVSFTKSARLDHTIIVFESRQQVETVSILQVNQSHLEARSPPS